MAIRLIMIRRTFDGTKCCSIKLVRGALKHVIRFDPSVQVAPGNERSDTLRRDCTCNTHYNARIFKYLIIFIPLLAILRLCILVLL